MQESLSRNTQRPGNTVDQHQLANTSIYPLPPPPSPHPSLNPGSSPTSKAIPLKMTQSPAPTRLVSGGRQRDCEGARRQELRRPFYNLPPFVRVTGMNGEYIAWHMAHDGPVAASRRETPVVGGDDVDPGRKGQKSRINTFRRRPKQAGRPRLGGDGGSRGLIYTGQRGKLATGETCTPQPSRQVPWVFGGERDVGGCVGGGRDVFGAVVGGDGTCQSAWLSERAGGIVIVGLEWDGGSRPVSGNGMANVVECFAMQWWHSR